MLLIYVAEQAGLAFALTNKCQSVTGIDLSKRNIDRAQLTLNRRPDNKIRFMHCNVSDIALEGRTPYDYAVLTYVIHEVNEEERINLLKEIAQVADKIIIADYLAPGPKGFWSYLTEVIEFIAGAEHFRNYKNYVANGGIHFLSKDAGLTIINEIENKPANNNIVILTK